MVQDKDYLTPFIREMPMIVNAAKEAFELEFEADINNIFNFEGRQQPLNTDPLNPGGINEAWEPLSEFTEDRKGSTTIMQDTRELINSLDSIIEDSEWDNMKNVVKVGWFEWAGGKNSGNRYLSMAHLAAIHEFGLNGALFRTPDGNVMGGPSIGRTMGARFRIRSWFSQFVDRNGDPYDVSGIINIPTRSMLRKAMDIMVPKSENILDKVILRYLLNIIRSN